MWLVLIMVGLVLAAFVGFTIPVLLILAIGFMLACIQWSLLK